MSDSIMWRLSWRKSRGSLFFLGNLRAGPGCRPSSPGRRRLFFRHKVHLPRRVIFPGKNTQYFRKNNPYFRKNCQYFRKFCQYFCFFPDGRRWPHGRREKRHPAVSQSSEPLPPEHSGLVRALPAGDWTGCTTDVGREGAGALFSRYYTC